MRFWTCVESPCFVGISLQNGGTWRKIAHKHKEMVILEILPHSTSVSHHDLGKCFYIENQASAYEVAGIFFQHLFMDDSRNDSN